VGRKAQGVYQHQENVAAGVELCIAAVEAGTGRQDEQDSEPQQRLLPARCTGALQRLQQEEWGWIGSQEELLQ